MALNTQDKKFITNSIAENNKQLITLVEVLINKSVKKNNQTIESLIDKYIQDNNKKIATLIDKSIEDNNAVLMDLIGRNFLTKDEFYETLTNELAPIKSDLSAIKTEIKSMRKIYDVKIAENVLEIAKIKAQLK